MVVDEEIMCSDHPIRSMRDYESVQILTRCAGPILLMARTHAGLRKEVQSFFPSFGARNSAPTLLNQPNGVNIGDADYGTLRQVAERG